MNASGTSRTATITAWAGAVGGWAIGADTLSDTGASISLKSGAAGVSYVLVSDTVSKHAGLHSGTAGTDIALWAGALVASRGTAVFRVNYNGDLYASSATITGSITANSGSIAGDFTIGTSGVLRSGATAYGTGTGIWADYNAGTPRFRVGNPAGNRITWDGTTLSIVGNGSGITSIDGGNITTGTVTAAKLNVSTLSAISGDMGTLTAGSITGGTIDGATIRAGSGDEVTLNSSGISLTTGSGTNNSLKWSNGARIFSDSETPGDTLVLDESNIRLNGDFWLPTTLATTTNAYEPLVMYSGSGQVFRKTDCYTGTIDLTTATSIGVENGLITSVS